LVWTGVDFLVPSRWFLLQWIAVKIGLRVMNTMPPSTMEISAEKLGPPGLRGDLVVVAIMLSETRRDEDRLHDNVRRPFKISARLGKTALVADSVKGDFGPEDGESYLRLPDEAVAGRVRFNDAMMDFKKNSKGEKSLISFHCSATSLADAKNRFFDFALPYLDHQAFVSNCPIFIQSIRIDDVNNQVQSIDYTSPYRDSSIQQHIVEVQKDLAPVFAMYREAKNSHSDFYKFLCYHKMMDGLLGSLRTEVKLRARKLSIELQQRRDLVPDDPAIALTYRNHVGTPIRKFFDDVLTPQFRNSIAHFITKDGSILNLSAPATMLKHAEIMYVTELCVRELIESHQRSAAQLVDRNDATLPSSELTNRSPPKPSVKHRSA
jgi:hypothetical protein